MGEISFNPQDHEWVFSHPLGSSIHGIFQARLLEWVAIPPAQGISLTQGSNPLLLHLLHCRQILYHWTTWGAPGSYAWHLKCHFYFSPKQEGTGLHSKAPCLFSVALRPGQRAGEAAPGPRVFPWVPPGVSTQTSSAVLLSPWCWQSPFKLTFTCTVQTLS